MNKRGSRVRGVVMAHLKQVYVVWRETILTPLQRTFSQTGFTFFTRFS